MHLSFGLQYPLDVHNVKLFLYQLFPFTVGQNRLPRESVDTYFTISEPFFNES